MAADYDPYEWWDDYDGFDHDLEFVEPGLDDYDFDDFYDEDHEDDESDSPILSDLAYRLDEDSEWMLDDELSHLDIENEFMSSSGNFNWTRSNEDSRFTSDVPSDSVRFFGEDRSHVSRVSGDDSEFLFDGDIDNSDDYDDPGLFSDENAFDFPVGFSETDEIVYQEYLLELWELSIGQRLDELGREYARWGNEQSLIREWRMTLSSH